MGVICIPVNDMFSRALLAHKMLSALGSSYVNSFRVQIVNQARH